MANIKKGDKVTTRFGEKLEVLDVQVRPHKSKKGQIIEEASTWFLAKSGDTNCWFNTSVLEGDK